MLLSLVKCVCDKCKREQVFDSWTDAKKSAWRQIVIDSIGGARGLVLSAPPSLRAVLCGDCVGGLDVNATPMADVMEA